MNLRKSYYLLSTLLLLGAAFLALSPSFVQPDFILPKRVDSLFVIYETETAHRVNQQADTLPLAAPLFNPGELGLAYEQLRIYTSDSIVLHGWYVPCADTNANTLLLVHDLNDSKLRLLDAVKQFHDRGLHVAVFDLRAHGESEGKIFSPGMIAVEDLKHVTDALLRRAETKHICLMGYGIGSAIVLQSAVVDGRADALVLQSPFANLENYLARYAYAKWGRLKPLWYPVFHRKTEQLLGHPVEAMDLPLLASVVKTPTLVVTGSEDELVFPTESLAVFDSSAAPKKDLLLIRKAGHQNIDELGGAEYYNRIAAFLVTAVPRKQQKTRFKRLAQL